MKSPERTASIIMSELAVALLATTACQATVSTPGDEVPARVAYVTATPDFSRLTTDGTTCENGMTPRPCSQILYKQPSLVRPLTTNDLLNNYGDSSVFWPHEAYGAQPGDAVAIVCQVEGGSVSTADGHTSTRWDVLEVTPDHLNQQTITEVESGTASFGIARNEDGSLKAVYAYAADLWLGDEYLPQLAPCTQMQNPGGYPAATS